MSNIALQLIGNKKSFKRSVVSLLFYYTLEFIKWTSNALLTNASERSAEF